jgi:uncharacterized membrane protein YuzA (DUF378 family)
MMKNVTPEMLKARTSHVINTLKEEKSLELMDKIALVLLFVGGITWGLLGIFNWNLIGALFSGFMARLIFIVVGIAAVYMAIVTPKILKYRQNHSHQGTMSHTEIS